MKIKRHDYPLPLRAEVATLVEKEINRAEFATPNGFMLRFEATSTEVLREGIQFARITVNRYGRIRSIKLVIISNTLPYVEMTRTLHFNLNPAQFFDRSYPLCQAVELFCGWQQEFCQLYEAGGLMVEVSARGE